MSKCIVVRPTELPAVEEISDELEDWQKMVGGNIEGWNFHAHITLICNDDRRGLPPNRLSPKHGVIHGTFFLAAADKEGENTDLTEAEVQMCLRELNTWRVAIQIDVPPGENEVK